MKRLIIAAAVACTCLALSPARADAWESRTSRSFRTPDSPARAQAVVSRMSVRDGSRFGNLPPGASANRTGPGIFKARSPLANVSARVTVQPARGGGSIVTERTSARSLCPGAATMANTIHAAATSLQQAYSRASSRTPGTR